MREQKLANKQIEQVKKIHGANTDSMIVAHQGANAFYNTPSQQFPPGNPVTATGSQIMRSMKKQYGAKKGKQVFHASISAKKPGTRKWHK